jgi:hypothetical protein
MAKPTTAGIVAGALIFVISLGFMTFRLAHSNSDAPADVQPSDSTTSDNESIK